MKFNMFDWFLNSNRYLHFIGGFILSFISFNIYYGIYVSIIAASCLEFKDKSHGGKWDWVDWIVTIIGGVFGGYIGHIIKLYI